MAYAIDRKRLVENQESIFHNYEIAKGPIPPNTPYFNEQFEGQFYDPDKAERLLKEAGFPGGKGLPEYLFISSSGRDADLIKEDLERVGFKIKKSAPYPGFVQQLFGGSKPVLMAFWNYITSPAVYDDIFSLFLSRKACVTDSAFSRVFAAWRKNRESMRNKELLHRLEEIVIDISPDIFLYHIDGEFRFLQSYVRGRQLGSAWGHKLHTVWLDDKMH